MHLFAACCSRPACQQPVLWTVLFRGTCWPVSNCVHTLMYIHSRANCLSIFLHPARDTASNYWVSTSVQPLLVDHSLVLIRQHDVEALAVQPQVDWHTAQLQACTSAEHMRWAYNQARPCISTPYHHRQGGSAGMHHAASKAWAQSEEHACHSRPTMSARYLL